MPTMPTCFNPAHCMGAMGTDKWTQDQLNSSNPRAYTGRNQHSLRDFPRFQPTRPYRAQSEARRGSGRHAERSNPRAHTGRNDAIRENPGCNNMFQPTRPYKAQLTTHLEHMLARRFQPTRPYRAQYYNSGTINASIWFQPTRPYKAQRLTSRISRGNVWCYNPRAHTRRNKEGPLGV